MASSTSLPPLGIVHSSSLSPLPAIAELADVSAQPPALPRNKSTGNLLNYYSSLGADSYPRGSDGAPMSDQSGLQRIRQPTSRPGLPVRSFSVVGNPHRDRSGLTSISPSSTIAEDLSRFPSESLHSFSFSRRSSLRPSCRSTVRRTFDLLQTRTDESPVVISEPSGEALSIATNGAANSARSDGGSACTGETLTFGGPLCSSPVILNDPRKPSPHPSDANPDLPDPPSSLPSARQFTLATTRSYSSGNAPEPPFGLSALSPVSPTGLDSFSSFASLGKGPLAHLYHIHDFPITQPADSKYESFVPKLKPTQSFPNLPSLTPPTQGGGQGQAHGHGPRALPSQQAVLTTSAIKPWKIHSANDQASLLFGITESGIRKLDALELIQPHRRAWLSSMLTDPLSGSPPPLSRGSTVSDASCRTPSSGSPVKTGSSSDDSSSNHSTPPANNKSPSVFGSGITARLLSKPRPSVARRMQKEAHEQARVTSRSTNVGQPPAAPVARHGHHKAGSRGVLVCGDVVPIQKSDGEAGSATLWIKEKHGALIWVLEEIVENVAVVSIDEVGCVVQTWGATKAIWNLDRIRPGIDARRLIPGLPKEPRSSIGRLDWEQIQKSQFYSARTSDDVTVPVTVELLDQHMISAVISSSPGLFSTKHLSGSLEDSLIRVSSFPNIAGIMILDSHSLAVTSSNSAFSGALFGRPSLAGLHVNQLIPNFDSLLELILEDVDGEVTEGLIFPSHCFRGAKAVLASGAKALPPSTASVLFGPACIEALHRDGAEILVDIQMRVVKNEKSSSLVSSSSLQTKSSQFLNTPGPSGSQGSDLVYAVWVAYSRDSHVSVTKERNSVSLQTKPPYSQPQDPVADDVDESANADGGVRISIPTLSPKSVLAKGTGSTSGRVKTASSGHKHGRKSIDEFTIVQEMGQGAYGQVKLCREKSTDNKVVIKYVTKKKILVDTWTRDRRLGTVPSEIHILDYLNRDGMRHPNIVEMLEFFEDDVNYYIEMTPHGLPGLDLFDYIEMQTTMTEDECRKIFLQVAQAVDHLHNKALVVHRDIKDENIILDGDGVIKLIDFGSAAYLKNGPFDVFVGTIDYAAPEVLSGRAYGGKEQDVWALGILLYTIIYKENPFYSVDEIMDQDLRVPYSMSDDSLEVIRMMLDRDVGNRAAIGDVLAHAWFRSGGGDGPSSAMETD